MRAASGHAGRETGTVSVCKKELESGFPVLREAVTAVDRTNLRRLERNFTFFTAVGTDDLCHFARTVIERAGTPAWISIFHWISLTLRETVFTDDSVTGRSVLREAIAAVNRPALRGLERNFALFAAVRTDCLVELAGAVLERAGTPARISLIHMIQPCR